MRKFLISILCVGIVLAMAGCTKPTNNDSTGVSSTATPSNNTESTTDSPEYEITQKPMVSVSVPVTTETEIAQDGTTIFTYAYQHISLIGPDPEVADKVILDFLNRVDEAAQQAESIRSSAKAEYSQDSQWNPYLCQLIYEPVRIDNSVLSFFGSYAGYSGSTHPETSYLSANYDLLTGDVLTLSHIITPETTADTLCQKIVDILHGQKRNDLYQGFESTIKERFAHGFTEDNFWYLSSTGLCFYFSPYEIAPYSAGVVTAEIPYSQLTGILNDAYFPAEREQAVGCVYAENYSETELEKYSQFAEVVLDADGEKILLYTDKSVYDIRLQASVNSTYYTVFAAYGLTPGDAIVVQATLSEQTPTPKVIYCTDEEHSYYISRESDNTTLTLTED